MIDEALFDAEEKMEKAVSVARDDLSTIRTGRANPGMFSRIVIDYYGTTTPITQLASINVPEARLVVIKPYEANQLYRVASYQDIQLPVDFHVDIGASEPCVPGNVDLYSPSQVREVR